MSASQAHAVFSTSGKALEASEEEKNNSKNAVDLAT